MLPGVKPLQPTLLLLGHARRLPTETVHVLLLAEELRRIVYAIDTELQRRDVVAVNADFDLLARLVGALAGDGEIGRSIFLLRLKRGQQRLNHCETQHYTKTTHKPAPRRMFHR